MTIPNGNGSSIKFFEIQIDDGNNGKLSTIENNFNGLQYIFRNLMKG